MGDLKQKLKEIPLLPGCYLYKNQAGEIIYVGKAKVLRNRVRQYFQNTQVKQQAEIWGLRTPHVDDREHKIARLVKEIDDITYIVTESETDALLLECRLIKDLQPRYNVLMKHEKHFPYLVIENTGDYPSLYMTEAWDGNSEVIGCFFSIDDGLRAIALLNAIWQTPLCNMPSHKKVGACFYCHIKKCCAPCEMSLESQAYKEKIAEIVQFFHGKDTAVFRRLRKEMQAEAAALHFEKALVYRKTLEDLERLKRKARRYQNIWDERDMFVFLRAYREVGFSLFFIRGLAVWDFVRFHENVLDAAQLEVFVCGLQSKAARLDDGQRLATSILEIMADKLFVPVKGRLQEAQILRLLRREFLVFSEEL